MRFAWVTDPDITKSVLEYATKASYDATGKFDQRVEGRWERADINVATSQAINGHKVEVDGLAPGTEYVYRVGDGGSLVSAVASFKTRAAKVAEFSFHWYTDPQMDDYEGYVKTMVPAMDRAFGEVPDPAFMLFTGDLVNHSYKSQEWDGFFKALEPRAASIPTYFTVGNHEFEGNPSDGYLDWESPDPYFTNFAARTNIPPNGPAYFGAAGGLPIAVGEEAKTLRNTVYYFEYGDALFVVLNHFDQLKLSELRPQLDWLKTVVQASDAKWKIAAYHHGPYLGRRNHPSNYLKITKAFDQAGIDLSISGHDGMYLRTHPLKDDLVVGDGKGTTYLTGAAAGDGQGYTWNPEIAGDYTAVYKDNQEASYQTVSVSPERIAITSTSRDPRTGAYSVNDTFQITQPLPSSLADWVPSTSPEPVLDKDFPPLVEGTYQISTPEQLRYVSNNFGDGFGQLPADGHYVLTKDIDLQHRRGFRPLGLPAVNAKDAGPGFTGTFDGAGHSITGLNLGYDQGWELDGKPSPTGFVGRLGAGGVVRNLGLVDVDYRDTEGPVGGVAGVVNGGSLDRVFVAGSVGGAQDTAGGLVGVLNGGSVTDSYATVNLDGEATTAGLIGEITGASTVERSLAAGAVITTGDAGGAVGDVKSADAVIGGIVAANRAVTGSTAGKLFAAGVAEARVAGNAVWADMPLTGTKAEQRGISELTQAELTAQATYQGLGWDFEAVWAWQPATSSAVAYPHLAGLSGQVNTLPFTNKAALAGLLAAVTGANAPNPAGYTPYSFQFLAATIGTAGAVMKDPYVSQTKVDAAVADLTTAIKFLNPLVAEKQFRAASIEELRFRIAELGSDEDTIWITDDIVADDQGGAIKVDAGKIRLSADEPTTLTAVGNVYFNVDGAELTVGPNLTIVQSTDSTALTAFFMVRNKGHLALQDATIRSDVTMSGSQGVIITEGSGPTVTIDRSTVSGKGARTIYAYNAGPLFTITDSTITNTNTALYRSDYVLNGTTVITGSTGGGAAIHDFRGSEVAGNVADKVVTLTKAGTGLAVTDPAYTISYVVTEPGAAAPGDLQGAVAYTEPINLPDGGTVWAALTHAGRHGIIRSFVVEAPAGPGDPSPACLAARKQADAAAKAVDKAEKAVQKAQTKVRDAEAKLEKSVASGRPAQAIKQAAAQVTKANAQLEETEAALTTAEAAHAAAVAQVTAACR
ncbi:purple acid phosphatase family protein [Micromonospora sp. CB01531]|uniref:purple acid phosphatase family protein n=1 Tax=Micromonospora sp. CB01531 TaxID=1718947 RepID=UPI001F523B27|nr:metallophosphoesterase family protein [Micromonospora sp. CB01531]